VTCPAQYYASIRETESRRGTFVAEGHGLSIRSRDPEHAFCRALVEAGISDGPIQFYHDGTPSLSFRSIHKAAKWTVDAHLNRRPFRESGPAGSDMGPDTAEAREGASTIRRKRRRLPDSRQSKRGGRRMTNLKSIAYAGHAGHVAENSGDEEDRLSAGVVVTFDRYLQQRCRGRLSQDAGAALEWVTRGRAHKPKRRTKA